MSEDKNIQQEPGAEQPDTEIEAAENEIDTVEAEIETAVSAENAEQVPAPEADGSEAAVSEPAPDKPEAPLPETAPAKHTARNAVIALLIAAAAFAVWWFTRSFEPAVITGVEPIVVYEDDEDIPGIIMDGIEAHGAEDRKDKVFEVEYSVLNEDGSVAAKLAQGEYRLLYKAVDKHSPDGVETTLTILPPDHEGPVIEGAQDIIAGLGETVSYRSGVTATDAVDGEVMLKIDSSAVDLDTLGDYPVVYSAEDRRGNRSEVSVNLKVVDRTEEDENGPIYLAEETLDEIVNDILTKIVTDDMSKLDKARAIYNYVHSSIRYVNGNYSEDWRRGAYVGFTRGRGDCFNYFACSKALLTAAGIDNLDLERYGGTTEHYWNLVNVGDGWYHFDACPYPIGYPMNGFMISEQQARDYTERCKSRVGYYVYDYSKCPVTVVGTPETATGSAITM